MFPVMSAGRQMLQERIRKAVTKGQLVQKGNCTQTPYVDDPTPCEGGPYMKQNCQGPDGTHTP